MIDMKQAVARAKAFIKDMYADEGVCDVGLEEVSRSEDGRQWLITIGFNTKQKPKSRSPLTEMLSTGVLGKIDLERQFKVVHVDARTGRVPTMKIRELQSMA